MNTSPRQENESVREYVTRLMEEAVALKGEDFVYRTPEDEDCCYIDPSDGSPSCIVGHVLVAAGVTAEIPEGHSASSVIPRLMNEWADDRRLLTALDHAQSRQDSGTPWGDALRVFKETLDE